MKQLRQYQIMAIDRLATLAGRGLKRLVFQLATGGGKTVSFAGLIKRYLTRHADKKVVILVHREELLKQARRTLYDWYEMVAAPVTAGSSYLPNVPVYVAMVETANNRLKKNPNYFGNVGLVIVDECHLGNFKKLYGYFPEALIIGFTATPISSSKLDPLKNQFQDIVCGIDIPDLIAQGSLVPNKTYHIENVKHKDLKVGSNGEFDEREMGNVYSSTKFVQNCLAAYKEHSLHKKTLIFNCNIEHSKKVHAAFLSFGYPSRHLDGEAPEPERLDTLKWFKETPNAILNNVGVLTTGFDEPSVESVIINRSTKSTPLWLQMTGRGSRPFPGKNFFYIVDLGGNVREHLDWCESRNWHDIFHNPDKPKPPGEAPLKACVGCKVEIHLSTIICKHCGAENKRQVVYDDAVISLSLVAGKKPLQIDVPALIAQNSQKKEYFTLHQVKSLIVLHAKKVWRIRRLTDADATKLMEMYQLQVKEWCKLMGRKYNQWHRDTTGVWMKEELKRAFNWEPANAAPVNQ